MQIYHEYEDCCMEDIPLSRTVALTYEDLMRERLVKNSNLQKRMRQIYMEGRIPDEVILETFRDHDRYHIYSKWMDYVYSHYPVDRAYWRMRAVDGFLLLSETRKAPDCFAVRTFEIWDYYDTVSRTLMKVPMEGLPMALLKLCSGKYRLGEILEKLEDGGFNREEVMRLLREFESRKWVLFAEI